jgi:predicted transcriptional regulator
MFNGKNNRKRTIGRTRWVQEVPIFKKDKKKNYVFDEKGRKIVERYKRIYHVPS